jgi:NAD+ kinase
MKNFAVFFNPNYINNKTVFDLLKKLHNTKEINFYKFKEQNGFLPDFIEEVKKNTKLDYILSFGGDGTFLRAVHFSLQSQTPILGVNLGKLGFLADSSLEELEKSIDDLKNNKFKIQERLLLNVVVKRKNKIILTDIALNDAVIYKGQTPRLFDIKFTSNQRFVVDTRCDGIIVATPTGSTAYSLSAGGPLLSPVMDAIIVAPLNPHILSVRPMVFPAQDKLEFCIQDSHEQGILQLDGRNAIELDRGDDIIVTKANKKVKVIKLTNKTFYQILRKKFHMGRK